MAFQTVLTGYLGLGTALSANNVLTEQSGTSYARVSTPVLYDPVTGMIELPQGVTFLAGGSWSASMYAAIFDASSGGNCLLAWQIPSFTLASGATQSYPAHSFDMTLKTPFPTGLTVPAGTVLGTVQNSLGSVLGSSIINPVDLNYSGSALVISSQVQTVALTDGATIATDCSLGATFSVTLGGNRALAKPTNMVIGRIYRWFFTQDGTGSRTLSFDASFLFVGGSKTLTTAAAGKDRITGFWDGTTMWCLLEKAFA